MRRWMVVGCLLWGCAWPASLVRAVEKPAVPDLTRGDEPDGHTDWTLGPTGARGWMYGWKLETSDARQILVTEVADGSPADGVLEPGDVLVGTGGRGFDSDARIAFGRAITQAETEDQGGRLSVLRWRDGETENVVIQLSVLGAYGGTAPYGCTKSRRILEQGCRALSERMKRQPSKRGNSIERSLNALALLASGDPQYRDLVKEEAQWAAEFSLQDSKSLHCWWYGYKNLFLAEYVLATGDESVLPGLERLTMEIVNGQSHVGTWGHRFAYEHNGILRGYGAMNSPALPLTMSLVLAREAGVEHPKLDEAIAKSRRILSFYVDKGAIPYGDHHPWLKTHDDNGKCGMGAVLFDFLGDGDAAGFFSRMSTASYGAEREAGHTGNFFNLVWAMPGVARSGPHATGAWLDAFGWYFDLARRWDGTFRFQGVPGSKTSYRGWDCTGAYLLAYAMPMKTLRLTGRRPSVAPQVDAAVARSLINDGRGWSPTGKSASYDSKSPVELLRGLRSWSPVVRERSAIAIGKRDDKEKAVPRLVADLASEDLHTRLGTCAALREIGPPAAAAVDPLREFLVGDHLWLRVQAADALAAIGKAARPAIPDLLQQVVTDDPADPRGMNARYLGFALFDQRKGLLTGSIKDVDPGLLMDAIRVVLRNEDGRVRGSVHSVLKKLTYEEIAPLLPAIHQAVVQQAPSGVMFSDGVRMSGLELLAKHRFKEGIPLCVELIEPERWGIKSRFTRCLKALETYGGSAAPALPALRELEEEISRTRKPSAGTTALVEQLQRTISRIESATETPRLRSFARTP